jgi:solute carrier family 12 sodium/potassium/chloride transporter 2
MSKISYTKFLVYAGTFAATLSSAIASVVGAPRVLQALARDHLYPMIHFFGVGHGANDDPFRGYFLVFFIAVGCSMIGRTNIISYYLEGLSLLSAYQRRP